MDGVVDGVAVVVVVVVVEAVATSVVVGVDEIEERDSWAALGSRTLDF